MALCNSALLSGFFSEWFSFLPNTTRPAFVDACVILRCPHSRTAHTALHLKIQRLEGFRNGSTADNSLPPWLVRTSYLQNNRDSSFKLPGDAVTDIYFFAQGRWEEIIIGQRWVGNVRRTEVRSEPEKENKNFPAALFFSQGKRGSNRVSHSPWLHKII